MAAEAGFDLVSRFVADDINVLPLRLTCVAEYAYHWLISHTRAPTPHLPDLRPTMQESR
jgi:hypothetical protein